jgi:TRAP-type uncharacterized transport system fused permease subunit
MALAFSTYQLDPRRLPPALQPGDAQPSTSASWCCMTFLLYPMPSRAAASSRAVGACVRLAAGRRRPGALGFYQWLFEGDLIQRSPAIRATMDLVRRHGDGDLLVFEAARRILGLALPHGLRRIFLLFGLFGQYLPAATARIAAIRLRPDRRTSSRFGTEGIYGIPTLVSATYIFLFILFGSFLEHAGMINLFNSLALGFVGHTKGGAGQGLGDLLGADGHHLRFGRRQRADHRPVHHPADEEASATRASSPAQWRRPPRMGGQIMPPVMGAVAFIMAENLNVPYAEIVKAAAIPAMLYYLTAFWMVHLEAGRAKNLLGLPKDRVPQSLARHARELVPGAAAGSVLVMDAVQRLHADVLRHGRPGAHRHPDPRRGASPRASPSTAFRVRLLDRASAWAPRPSSGTWRPGASIPLLGAHRRCWPPSLLRHQGRAQDPAHS